MPYCRISLGRSQISDTFFSELLFSKYDAASNAQSRFLEYSFLVLPHVIFEEIIELAESKTKVCNSDVTVSGIVRR